MKLYRIRDWHRFYEASDNKKTDGPLTWVSIRTKTDGLGYRRIASRKDRTDLLAAWYLLVGIAAKQKREERGKIARDGRPLTCEEMEMMTGFPAQVFERALIFFSSPEQGWLDSDEFGQIRTDSDSLGQVPPTLPTVHTLPTVPTNPPDGGRFDQFWSNYPLKVGKTECRKAFEKLPDKAHVIAAAKEYGAAVALWKDEDRKFIPHPATWLNQGRYDDDRATWQRNAQPKDKWQDHIDRREALAREKDDINAGMERAGRLYADILDAKTA